MARRKLTQEQAEEARRRYWGPRQVGWVDGLPPPRSDWKQLGLMSQADLAVEYGIAEPNMWAILSGRTYLKRPRKKSPRLFGPRNTERRAYSDEEWTLAVQLYAEGNSARWIYRTFGISTCSLKAWCKEQGAEWRGNPRVKGVVA